ncbi:MAG: NAD(P)H-binding protein [Thalassotalea sp.]
MKINQSIGIIGGGWLGLALAKQLIQYQVPVTVTVRKDTKLQVLAAQNIVAQLLELPNNCQPDNPVFQQDVLVIAITPGFKQGKTDYADNIKTLLAAAQHNKVKKIILISSTGIYLGVNERVDEHSIITPNSAKTRLLYEAEQAVLNYSANSAVLRLAGLVGEDRLPGKFLAGKTELPAGDAPVNLIHQKDVIGLLCALINKQVTAGVFIGVSKTSASKARFYQQAAVAMGLTPPTFSSSIVAKLTPAEQVERSTAANTETIKSHQVNGDKTRQLLAYQYQYDDLLQWLAEVKKG